MLGLIMQVYKNNDWKNVVLNFKGIKIPNGWSIDNVSNRLQEFKSSKMLTSTGGKIGAYPFFNSSEKQTLFSNDYLVDDESVIVTTGGAFSFAKYYKGKFSYSSDVWCFKMKEDNNKFFTYLFKYFFQDIQNLSVKGSTLKHLNKRDFKNIQFHFPPIEEQNAIVSILSSQESIISKTSDLIAKLDKRNKFMVDELLSGRLRVKEENGQPIFYKNESNNWQTIKFNGGNMDIPKDWEAVKLEGYINCNMGETILSMNIKQARFTNSIPVVSASKDDKYFGYIDKKVVKKVLKNGDLTICARGSIGFPRIVKEDVASTQTTLQIRSDKLDLNYLCIFLDANHDIFFNSTGGVVPQLTISMVNNFDIAQPKNKYEMENILKIINKLTKEKQKYEDILKKEEQTFTFLLEELMSGRLRIKV